MCSTDISSAPKCISITSPKPKTIPKAQVAPMLQSNTKDLLPPSPELAGGEYMVPDDQSPDDHKRNLGEHQCDVFKDALGLHMKVYIGESKA